ncbi:nucleolar protein 8 [Apophysomyces sp. BC1015]|nr:nucleolar protein 8 [Apophysomyces sp. BC1015]
MTRLDDTTLADHVEKRIYIGGLHESVTEDLLIDRFSKFGKITQLTVGKGSEGQCRGFGHMTISTTSKQWQTCLSTYNGAKWKGKNMRLEEARPDHVERKRKEEEECKIKEEKQRKRLLRWNDSDGFLAKDMTPVTDSNMKTRKGWKRGRYGRAISVMRLQKEDGTRFVFDPTHYKNNLTKLYNIDAKMKPTHKLPMMYDEYSDSDDSVADWKQHQHKENLDKLTSETPVDQTEDINESAKTKGDEKRLAAIERRAEEQQAKREMMQQSFAAMDKEERQNHVTFEDSDQENMINEENFIEDEVKNSTETTKWLFDSESEDDADLEIKINPVLEGEKGRERLALQSRFKGDDRFKLGEDFMDDDENDDSSIPGDEIAKELGAEKDQSMDILKSMFGDQGVVRKKPELQWTGGARFDPDAENASDFILQSKKTITSDDEDENDNASGDENEEEEEPWVSVARPQSAAPEVSTEKHYVVNVNMKPLFGAEDGMTRGNLHAVTNIYGYFPNLPASQPFKLFGGDDNDNDVNDAAAQPKNESQVESVSFVPKNKEAHAALGLFFFFHVDDPGLLKRSCFSYDPSGIFQQHEDRETYEAAWKKQKTQTGAILRKRQRASMKKTQKQVLRGLQ